MSSVAKVSSAALQADFLVRAFFDLLLDTGVEAAGIELLGLRFLLAFAPALSLEALPHRAAPTLVQALLCCVLRALQGFAFTCMRDFYYQSVITAQAHEHVHNCMLSVTNFVS